MDIRPLKPGDAAEKALMEEFYGQMGFEARAFFNHGDGNRRFTLSYLDGACGENSVHWIAVEDGRVRSLTTRTGAVWRCGAVIIASETNFPRSSGSLHCSSRSDFTATCRCRCRSTPRYNRA